MADRPTLGVSRLRIQSSKVAWLLLFWWTKTTFWLRYWIKIWLQKPLMRLGIGSQDDDDDVESVKNEIVDDDASSRDDTVKNQLDSAMPYGLGNNGNLCFVNAVLQCLARVPAFLESVDRALRTCTQLQMVHQADNVHVQKVLFAETLVSVLRGICQEEKLELELEVKAKQDRVRDIRDDNQQKMRKFRSVASQCTYLVSSAASRQEQQDAEEFLSFLLELLHNLLRAPAIQPERHKEERQHFLQSEKRFLKKMQCYDPNDPRSIISLTIASEKGDQTLADCLEHYRHPEQLSGENRVYCDGYCRVKTTRLTQILLQRVPPVLVFRLQRFKHTSFRGRIEKVDTPVSFPCGRDDLLDITMNAFFREEEKRVTFKLIAVCAHLGSSIDSGHYVAYVRHQDLRRDATPSDQWLRIDDEVVTVIDEAMLRKETLSSAYLLFYAQVCR
ncbi:hypothetical protein KXD40_002959 [Peronospora effusa]|uniref:Ubiquitin carboxyl-terminal hydrolase n=1 Tax=Peronospora effusa TaxID=542832 RepID=A0A3M6VVS4_9STRA|nr:hypothetical protein DD238_003130 [Peronospora effusa]RQM14756.1 hypothetical protein DD237_002174 [Peronospora effusa]UIZ29324.1 hypothetical protein KXD40_002959 [Peronospora effusa]